MKVSEIIRVPEIEQLFPKPHNYEEIKADVVQRGIQEAVAVNMANQLLCGYTRLAIAEDLRLEDVPHRTVDVSEPFTMLEYAILDNIRRRQLSDLQLVEYGIRLEGVYGERQGQRSDLGTDCPEVKSGRTRDIVAAELSEKTGVKMSGKKYSRLRDIAMKASPETKQQLNDGDISQKKALALCSFDLATQERLLIAETKTSDKEITTAGILRTEQATQPHISHNSGNNEWYSPQKYTDAAREVLGSIDLDPASSQLANTTVKARQIYTIDDKGLQQDWIGNIWLNPPYAANLVSEFVEKLATERSLGNVKSAIVLVNNATETKWFAALVDISSAICFPTGRVKFWRENGKTNAPLQGQAIIYIGNKTDTFRDHFKHFGWIVDVRLGTTRDRREISSNAEEGLYGGAEL